MPAHRDQIIEGESLFKDGDYESALATFEAVLEDDDANTHALNDAGLTAQELGRASDAAEYFERALDADPANANAFFSLIDLLAGMGEDDLAREAFAEYADDVPESEEKRQYAEALGASGSDYGEQDLIGQLKHDADEENVLKVGFVCGPDQKFITDIEEGIAKRHHVKTLHFGHLDDKHALVYDIDLPAIQQLMDWADVVWFEWCDQMIVHASNKLRKTCKVICRLHRYEAFTQMPLQMNRSFLDELVLVSSGMRDVIDQQLPELAGQISTTVISNGVDLDQFTYREHQAGFDLAYVGYLHHRKNPSLMLQCLNMLVREDERYTLHIAGLFQRPVWKFYFEHMVEAMDFHDNVVLHGWVDDVSTWLDDKNYLLSTSIHESFGYGIAEAMARGIKPLIHHFPGAGELFPEKHLFRTVPEMVEQVRSGEYNSRAYRRHIEKHYALEDQIDLTDQLLRDTARRVEAMPIFEESALRDLSRSVAAS